MSLVIAIDGGGTKTQLLCATDQSQVLGEGLAGPASLAVSSPETAKTNIQAALTQAMSAVVPTEQVKAVVLGLAGVNTPEQIAFAKQLFEPIFEHFQLPPMQFTVVNDVEIALANGSTADNALALIAGTGSNCFGHNAQGKTAKVGGWDYLLSDEGSGYAVGLAALKVTAQSADGRLPHSTLQDLLFEHFAVDSLLGLSNKVYSPPLTKTQIAELCPLVQEAATHNDQAAMQIIHQAIDDWLSAVKAVITQLELQNVPADLVLAGSLTTVPFLLRV